MPVAFKLLPSPKCSQNNILSALNVQCFMGFQVWIFTASGQANLITQPMQLRNRSWNSPQQVRVEAAPVRAHLQWRSGGAKFGRKLQLNFLVNLFQDIRKFSLIRENLRIGENNLSLILEFRGFREKILNSQRKKFP